MWLAEASTSSPWGRSARSQGCTLAEAKTAPDTFQQLRLLTEGRRPLNIWFAQYICFPDLWLT